MKILMLDKRETLEASESWACRLIEQGLAILPPFEPPVIEAAPRGEEPEEKPAKKASKK